MNCLKALRCLFCGHDVVNEVVSANQGEMILSELNGKRTVFYVTDPAMVTHVRRSCSWCGRQFGFGPWIWRGRVLLGAVLVALMGTPSWARAEDNGTHKATAQAADRPTTRGESRHAAPYTEFRVYSAPWCGPCKALLREWQARGAVVTKFYVDALPEGMTEFPTVFGRRTAGVWVHVDAARAAVGEGTKVEVYEYNGR